MLEKALIASSLFLTVFAVPSIFFAETQTFKPFTDCIP